MDNLIAEFNLASTLIAVTLTVTALAAGFVERSPLSFPMMFLGLGFALGSWGFGIIEFGPHDPAVGIVATMTLTLVLFFDAMKLQVDELGKRWLIPVLVLGPGTALIIILGAVPLALLIGFGWMTAFIGGAILASTDPVVLREVLREHRIPNSVRQILKIEAGMNDIVVLPIILILIAVARAHVDSAMGWATLLAQLVFLGPIIGFSIGAAGAWLMSKIDDRMGIRLEYKALYGIGLVVAAYQACSYAGGDGFLGAFFAGLGVAVVSHKLSHSFLDYGEATSEMAMLLAFVLFGVVLSGLIDTVPIYPALILAALVIFVIRPSVLGLVLAKAHLSWEARVFISWFGPRGLNSLLLAILVVHAGLPGAELLLATVGVVVLASVVIHGASSTPFSLWYGRKIDQEDLAEEYEETAADLFDGHGTVSATNGNGHSEHALNGVETLVSLNGDAKSVNGHHTTKVHN